MIGRTLVQNALLLGVLLVSLTSFAAEPRFEDFKVEDIYQGKNHELVVDDQSDDNWKTYRSNAIKRKVNFAGHYIVYTGGCGGGAICGEVLDARTGKIVSGFPNAYELESPDGSFYGAVFHINSRLLVITGISADPEKDQNGNVLPAQNRIRYYEFTGHELVLIKAD